MKIGEKFTDGGRVLEVIDIINGMVVSKVIGLEGTTPIEEKKEEVDEYMGLPFVEVPETPKKRGRKPSK